MEIEEKILPPGHGKSYNAVSSIARSSPVIVLFALPTHTAMANIVRYYQQVLVKASKRRPSHYILLYTGTNNYCIFEDIGFLLKLKSRYSLTELRQRFKLSPEGVQVWEDIYNVLEGVENGKYDREEAKTRIKAILGRFKRSVICRELCPVGLYVRKHADKARKILSQPKLITHMRVDAFQSDRLVFEPETVLNANPDIRKLICPRLVLYAKLAVNRKTGKPVYTYQRNSLTIVQHRAYEFVKRAMTSRLAPTGKTLSRTIIDEYDSIVSNVDPIPLVSLRSVERIHEELGRALSSSSYGPYSFILYPELKAYIRFIYELLGAIIEKARKNLKEKTYSPILLPFVEGAQAQLSYEHPSDPTVLPPYAPKPLAYSDITGDDELYDIVKNLYNPDEDKENIRAGRALALKQPVKAEYYSPEKGWTVKEIDVEGLLNSIFRPILSYPLLAYYYTISEEGLLSIVTYDHAVSMILDDNSQLLSATALDWTRIWQGVCPARRRHPLTVQIARAIRTLGTLQGCTLEEREEYANRKYETYKCRKIVYENGTLAQLVGETGANPTHKTVEIRIHRELLAGRELREYQSYYEKHYRPELPTFPRDRRQLPKAVFQYTGILHRLRERQKRALVLAQNKTIAGILAGMLKLSREENYYYDDNIIITWIRGRITRGVDIPVGNIDYILVAGTPYGRPTTIIPGTPEYMPTTTLTTQLSLTRRGNVRIVHLPLVINLAVNELLQAIGRGIRDARRTGKKVKIIMPYAIRKWTETYNPGWF